MKNKKKILLSLGVLPVLGAAIGLPISFSISSKSESLADKMMDTIDSNIYISKSDKSMGDIYGWLKDPKSKDLPQEGKTYYSNDATTVVLKNILENNLSKSKEKALLKDSYFKELKSKNFKDSKEDIEFTILKGFANDSIKVKMQTKLTIIKPEIKNLGSASKDITISFTD